MEYLMSALISFAAGIIASMGLGGGFVLVLYLTLAVGLPQMEAQWINLLFFLPIGLLAFLIHRKNGLIERSVLLPTLAGALVGVVIGAYAAHRLDNDSLQKLFAVFLLFIGCRELFGKGQKEASKKGPS